MTLMTHSDASYLSEPEARSGAGGFFFLPRKGTPDSSQAVNGAIDIICQIIPTVVSSAAEAEYAALFINGQNALILRQTLIDLGHPQTAAVIITDNTTAYGIANSTTKQKRSRSMDMRYHWVRNRVELGDLKVVWEDGVLNLADFFTKTHPLHHYKTCRHIYADFCT
jgi:hypothetical protein